MNLEETLANEAKKAAEAKAEQERQLKEALENRTTFIDTTPTAAFLDSIYGGQSVKGAEAVQKAAAQQEDVLQGLLKEKRINEDKSSSLAAARLSSQEQARAIAEAGKEGRQDKSQIQNAFKDVVGVFGKERTASDEYNRQIGGIEDAIVDGSYERIKGQLSNFARAVNAEKGVLTDQDLGRTFIDTLDSTLVKYKARLDKSGKLNPADLVNLTNAINDSKRRFYAARDKRISDRKASYAGNPFYREAVQQLESVPGSGITTGMIQQPMAPQAPAGAPTMDAIQAEIARRKQKGS